MLVLVHVVQLTHYVPSPSKPSMYTQPGRNTDGHLPRMSCKTNTRTTPWIAQRPACSFVVSTILNHPSSGILNQLADPPLHSAQFIQPEQGMGVQPSQLLPHHHPKLYTRPGAPPSSTSFVVMVLRQGLFSRGDTLVVGDGA